MNAKLNKLLFSEVRKKVDLGSYAQAKADEMTKHLGMPKKSSDDQGFKRFVAKVAKLTDENMHTKSLLTIAEAFLPEEIEMINALKGIEMVHEYVGHLPNDLSEIRREISTKIFELLQSKLPEEKISQLFGAM